MLDKLNAIANAIHELMAEHAAKSGQPSASAQEGSPKEEASESPDQESAEKDTDPAVRAQKSIRKALGGQKEPK